MNSVLGLLAILAAPVLAIPPPDFGFPEAPNHTTLSVTYQHNGSPLIVEEGQLFGVAVTNSTPTLAIASDNYESLAEYNGSYFVIMVDPDASSPDNATNRFILHWMATDMTISLDDPAPQALVNQTAEILPYRPPRPPATSDAHRYLFYAFFQPPNFTIPEAYSGYGPDNRTRFNLTTFLDDSGLGQTPAAAQYFYASNRTDVPDDFIAAAGEEYPGGNGAMVTEGTGSSPNTTASETASETASATDSSSSSGTESATDTSATATATTPGSAAASWKPYTLDFGILGSGAAIAVAVAAGMMLM